MAKKVGVSPATASHPDILVLVELGGAVFREPTVALANVNQN